MNKKGFTLIELLVVVLIIGILAGIALPQYRRSVEKAKVSEALINIKAMEETINRYILANGYPDRIIYFEEFADIELSGGEWGEYNEYTTENFEYNTHITPNTYSVEVYRQNGDLDIYVLNIYNEPGRNIYTKTCVTDHTDIGRYVCKYLETQGWEYLDGDM